MRWIFYALAGGLAMLAVTTPALAAPKVDADPSVEYVVTPQAGVWMVLAGSYKGPDAHNLAHQLVYQLRSRDNYPAFIFDFSEGKRREQDANMAAMQRNMPGVPVRTPRPVEDEFGVLAGGYKTMEDAREAMERIRKLPLPVLKLPGDKPAYDTMPFIDKKTGEEKGTVAVNPYWRSFVVRNPVVPLEKPDPNKADPFMKRLNKDEEYSLLNCKHPWTLVIKQYEGVSVIEPPTTDYKIFKLFGKDDKNSDVLNAAALNAHNLAEALRKKELDAYVLHTRHSSLVTVGAFDSPDDPQLLRMQRALSLKMDQPKDGKPVDPKQLQFFAQPLPMKVPEVEK
jgi:hypothetical protein